MLNRRTLLAAGGVAAGIVAVPRLLEPHTADSEAVADGGHVHVHTEPVALRQGVRPAIVPFAKPMPVAPVLKPQISNPLFEVYQLRIRKCEAEILPGLRTPVLGYEGRFVGPTIRATAGRRTYVTFANELDETTNVHLHGGHTPARHDGHPMDLIEPGRSRQYVYPNEQQGASLWYHGHGHGTEADHVYRGLQGAYVIEDRAEARLRLPSGAYDVPILLRDIEFDPAGNLVVFDNPANRDIVLANGVPQPYFRVSARKYRFRLYNTALSKYFTLSLGSGPMTVVATDGGLLSAPVQVQELELGSAERADIVVDFSKFPVGSQVVLSEATAGPILRFDVVTEERDDSRVPDVLRPLPVLPAAVRERDINLSFDFNVPIGSPPNGMINGKTFEMDRVDLTVKRGTSEIWNVHSTDPDGVHHTFHLHLVQFRVLERGGLPPQPSEAGWKDTVRIVPGEPVRIQAQFTGYTGRYLYHCHFLEHSLIGMMGQMEIVP